jgi:hypothetical protein
MYLLNCSHVSTEKDDHLELGYSLLKFENLGITVIISVLFQLNLVKQGYNQPPWP